MFITLRAAFSTGHYCATISPDVKPKDAKKIIALKPTAKALKKSSSKASPKDIEIEVVSAGEEATGDAVILPPLSEDLEKTDLVATSVPVEIEVEDVPEESASRGITRYDPLSTYLSEVRRNPPLTREEEHSLAVLYYKDKDREAAVKLISSNLWLVVKIARDYERAARSLLDIIQEGNIGLMEAIKNFDPYRGVRFPSYAVWWIKAYIIRYILANWRLVKIGTTQAQRRLFFNLQKEKEKLERDGFYPTAKLLAEKLDVKESEVTEMEQRLGGGDVSVDAPMNSAHDDGATLLSMLPSPETSAEGLIMEEERRHFILEAIREFSEISNEKERAILKDRLLNDEKATLQELADKLSVSVERVRQIEERLKERLKVFILEKISKEKKEDIEVT